MPRYHFNVFDGRAMLDREGHQLPDLQTARNEAVCLAGALLREHGEKFWTGEGWHMEVTDDAGAQLFRLDFTAALSPIARAKFN